MVVHIDTIVDVSEIEREFVRGGIDSVVFVIHT